MEILNMAIIGALIMTVGVIGTGVWSMAHGGEFDRKHSTQIMFARVGMQGITFLLLLFAVYLSS
jgi:hypothetical protein